MLQPDYIDKSSTECQLTLTEREAHLRNVQQSREELHSSISLKGLNQLQKEGVDFRCIERSYIEHLSLFVSD